MIVGPSDSSFHKKWYKTERTIYSKEIVIYESFRHVNKLGSGYHVFPFKITLRPKDSGTCTLSQYVDNFYVEANSYYGIDAFLKVEGVFKPVLTDNVRVEMRTYHQKTRKITDTINITSCLCLMSTNLIIIGHTDKDKYSTTDAISFFTRLSNNTYGIKSVKLRLYCHLTLRTKNNVVNKTKLVASSDRSIIKLNDKNTE
ncbi:hypothetical protein VCUG_02705 [Vavraia culicis subsp. floridensis]|uniref:Arrestin-like N-terminal domain-containing protein n=1 Tax=Vavraia culicis (isolate floridensis) TaxID=948595 RepID=L2GR91_VAVCU|nr:uncharacterized protein VCUG_02705 [Vavraia culicis subsp. floridensis]ELA45808.1 hypothetical protein VCUG_02705 [Vavraia culicis subsp. floridensis]